VFFFGVKLEGLFRLAADTEKMQLWVGKLEADPSGSELGAINDPHLLANLLKRYLRSLVPPLLTHEL
jgi:RhoGAP domain